MSKTHWLLACSVMVMASCAERVAAPPQAAVPSQADAAEVMPTASTVAPTPTAQRGAGKAYELLGTEVWNVPDPVSARDYQVFVAVPRDYAAHPERHYPVLYITDADYAFPLLRQIGRRLNLDGAKIDDAILVGLSYALGDDGMVSRRRDYTPTAASSDGAPAGAVHGHGQAYAAYLREQVLPFVAQRYRTDERRRLFLGHSYGALLGAQILLSEPTLFSGYILGSPSLWYDHHVMAAQEQRFAAAHRDLAARVYVYVGEDERPQQGTGADMVADAQVLERALRSRRYPSLQLRLDVLNDEDHLSVAPRGFTHGLKYLLGTRAP